MGMGYALAAAITLIVAFPFVWAAWWLVDGIVDALGGHRTPATR
jgi:hypothetical protein